MMFDSGFGGFELTFDAASAQIRDTRAHPRSDEEREYFDLETGEPVDFYAPFGDP
jgi:hypothetical protein